MTQSPLLQKIDEQTLFRFRTNLILIFTVLLAGCVGAPPNEDYAMASVAMESAKNAGASKYATGYWNKCLTTYKQAQDGYEEKHYNEAKAFFIKARTYAEKAENSARLKRLRSGEVF